MAYTYLIKIKPENKYYYGVRYANGCSPSELGTTYFTSSKHMKILFERYSIEDFSFEVRKEFNDVNKAREWESKVLRRINAVKRQDFINKTDNISICPIAALEGNKKANSNVSLETRRKRSEKLKGRSYTKEALHNMSLAKKGKSPSEKHYTSNKIKVNNEMIFPSIKSFYNQFKSELNVPYSTLSGKLKKFGSLNINNYRIEKLNGNV